MIPPEPRRRWLHDWFDALLVFVMAFSGVHVAREALGALCRYFLGVAL